MGESATRAMLQTKIHKLPPTEFSGSGIYAIYYNGDFVPYIGISKSNSDGNFTLPIYVGKAIPAGGRKGKFDYSVRGNSLYRRLCEHAESIKAASNLDIEDFFVVIWLLMTSGFLWQNHCLYLCFPRSGI